MSNTQSDTDADDLDIASLSTDAIAGLIEGVALVGPTGDHLTLDEVIGDLAASHEALDDYKRGALTMTQCIDERLQEAEAAGDDALVALLRETKRTSFGVYLRLHRGDEELLGDRDGTFNDYFDDAGVDVDPGIEADDD